MFPRGPAGRRRIHARPRCIGFRLLRFELMERRDLLSAASSTDEPSTSLMVPSLALAAGTSESQEVLPTFITADQANDEILVGSKTPQGYTPAQVRQAYGVNQITFDGGSIVGDGTGQTIAIVDYYDDPTIATDLATFDQQFGLPAPPSFKKVDQYGGTNYPSVETGGSNGSWEMEEALDVEWAHAMAPGANILVVEVSATSGNLYAAIQYAASVPGVSVVSMSFGSPEGSSETQNDSYFTTPAGHAGVTFVAGSGDNGAPGIYPAYSPNVLAAGGTSLTAGTTGNYESETAWSLVNGNGGGGGISQYEPQPAYQTGVVTQSSTQRTIPDVSFDANPSTGVAIVDSFDLGSLSPWIQIGGTSLAAPAMSGLIAIANQGRSEAGLPSLDGPSQTLPRIYSLPASDFHDITSGNNGFAAGPGYDLATGLGSPVANLFVPDLAHSTGMSVVGSTPQVSVVQNTAPTSYTLYFSDAYNASSVTAGAFTVNGIAANSYTLTSSTSITFNFTSSPVTSAGEQAMQLAAGTITRSSDSSPVAGFQASFRYDPHPISATSFSPSTGSLVTAPLATLTVNFSEPYAPSSISTSNLSLSQGTVTGYTLINSTTVAYNLSGLTEEGTLTASLAAGAVTDTAGDPGAAGNASFTLDVTTVAFPTPLAAVGVPAGQISQAAVSGSINFVGDTDSYTLSLAAGQTLSLAMLPAAGLTGQIVLSGPGVNDTASSASAGSAAVLESVAIGSAGTYTITVGGMSNGTGAYTLEALLNAAIEAELLGLGNDDSQAAAQSLAGSFRLLVGTASEAGAIGSLSSATDQDWYSFTLSAGESVSLAALAATGGPGLELRDPNGNLIATGSSAGTISAVNDYIATAAGTYYARIYGTSAESYSLVITENADLSLGQNSSLTTAMPINSAPQAGQQVVTGQLGSDLIEGFESNSLASYTATSSLYDDATLTPTAAHDGALGLSSGIDLNWIYNSANQVQQGETLSTWVRFVGAANGDAYFGFGASSAGALSLALKANTGQLVLEDNSAWGYTPIGSADQTYQANTWYRLQVNWSVGGAIVGQLYASDGVTLLSTVTAADNSFSSGGLAFSAFSTSGVSIDFDSVTASVDSTNFYPVQMAGGGVLNASTSTPGDSGGLPGNTLDPWIQIFNAAGTLVAADDSYAPDGRNVQLSYAVPAGGAGTYYVAVSPSPLTTTATTGTYVLALSGTLLNHAPVLNTSVAMALPTFAEDPATNAGTLVSSLLATGAGGSPISDADPGAVQGIAVTGVDDSNGTWQYSLDGGNTWAAFNSPGPSNALLLASGAQDRIRYVPDQYYDGNPASSISFRAWDQTSGTAGGLADTTLSGNSTAFSAAVGTATVTITEVNNPPVVLTGALLNVQVVQGSGPTSLGLSGVTYGPGGGADEQSQTLTYTVTSVPNAVGGSILIPGNPTPLVVGQVITLAQLQSLEFVESAGDPGLSGTFSYNVTDNGTTDGQPDPKTLSQSLPITIVSRPETQLVADIDPGSASSSPRDFTLVNNTIFFIAADGAYLTALWKTDGTTAGTVLVKDLSTTGSTTYSNDLTAMNGELYFRSSGEFWSSNGTASGTQVIKSGVDPFDMVDLNGELIFANTISSQLWESDGTTAGTVLVKQINPTGIANPTNLTVVGNTVYFQATDGTDGPELWKTDGTTAGTVLVKDINPGSAGSYPSSLVNLNGELFFGVGNVTPQLWMSNGTTAGTLGVSDAAGIAIGSAADLTVFNNQVYFFADDGNGNYALWKTNGTTAGTQIVAELSAFAAGSQPMNMENAGDRLFFTDSVGGEQQLWTSDGTTAGTVVLTNVAGGLNASNLTVVNGMLLFSASNGTLGTELWRSDGTVSGTEMIADIDPGSGSSNPGNFANINGTLYFSANNGTNGIELWAYSHLPPSTTGLADVAVAENAAPTMMNLFSAFSDPVEASAGMTYTVVGDTNPNLFSSLPIDPIAGTLALNYQPNIYGQANITVEVTDSIGQSVETTFTVTVGNNNHAPVLDASVPLSLPTIGEDPSSNLGSSVPALLATGAQGNPISDADSGAYQGVAIVAADNSNGTWQFSLNGGTSWAAVGSVSTTNSLLLASTPMDLLRFVPNLYWNGTATVTLRAWDQSTGYVGAYVDTTVTGGSSAFSTAAVTASQIIYAVNQPPVLATGAVNPLTVVLSSAVTSLGLSGVTYGPGGGANENSQTLSYTIAAVPDPALGTIVLAGNTTPLTVGTTLSPTDLQGLRFDPNPADTTGGHSTFSFDVTDDGTTDGQPDPQTLGQSLTVYVNLQSSVALVSDINSVTASATPANFTAVGSTLFFTANDGLHGVELWKTDGTAAGTVMVDDIYTGTNGSNPANLTDVNGILYFSANSANYGIELWRSDGTAAGTYLVANINTGVVSSNPSNFTNVNGTLYFTATDSTHGTELWKSDGTTAGTVIVDDIDPGTASSSPANLTNVNGTLFFTATDGTHGVELWKTDGTAAGTVMVDDIDSGLGSSSPANLTNVNGTLFFSANDGTNGTELWKSDGTTAGTVMVDNIDPGSGSSNPAHLVAFNNVLIFAATDGTHGTELWRSDGTTAGTTMVDDIDAGAGSGNPTGFTLFANDLYFSAFNSNGTLLWKTDGTAAGTSVVSSGVSNLLPGSLTVVGSTLFFTGTQSASGTELWETDGTAAGTRLVDDINPGTGSSNPAGLTGFNGMLLFAANDGVHGTQLWESSGTAAGTQMVDDINPGTSSSSPTDLVNFNGLVYFTANDGVHGTQMWESNGTAAGTQMVDDIVNGTNGSNPADLTVVGNTLFFVATDPTHGNELWKTDGTAAGTVLVDDIDPGTASSSPSNLTNVNGTLFFTAYDGTHGTELWESNGTAAGTFMVLDIYPGSSTSLPIDLVALNGILYFSANDGTHGQELWRSDGTAAGTYMVSDINSGSSGSSPNSLTAFNGQLYFTANDGVHGSELWKSNGTAAGTVIVDDLNPGSAGSFPSELTVVGNTLFFATTESGTSTVYQLWKSDGTAGGTSSLGTFTSAITNMLNDNGVLLFSAGDASGGTELWRSDGTIAGTSKILGLNPNTAATNLPWMTAVDGLVYFPANDTVHGSELWVTNGTAAGTAMVADIYPGSAGSNPSGLVNVNGVLYFSAQDPTHGIELWRLSNFAPTTAGIGNVQVAEDATPTHINLSQAFTDDNDNSTNLTYTITGDTNPALFASVPIDSDGNLVLNYAPGQYGNATLTVQATDSGGLSTSTSFNVQVSFIDTGPTVIGVYASGSAWAPSYLSMLDSAGLGDSSASGLGVKLADGANQLATMLPWTNIDTLSVAFDEGVTVSQSSLTLYNSSNDPIASTGFSYNSTANVATWTFPALTLDKYWIALSAAAVTDSLGTELDGQWTTGVSTFAAGSGNSTPGGDFDYRFNVAPGDANDSGSITNSDVLQVKLLVGAESSASNYRQDLNGSGNITNGDVLLDKLAVGGNIDSIAEPTLPAPATPAIAPAAAVVTDAAQPFAASDTAVASPATSAIIAGLGAAVDDDTSANAAPAPAAALAVQAIVAAPSNAPAAAPLPAPMLAALPTATDSTQSIELTVLPSQPSPASAVLPVAAMAPNAISATSPASTVQVSLAGSSRLTITDTTTAEPSAALPQLSANALDWLAGPSASLSSNVATMPSALLGSLRPALSTQPYAAIDAALAEDDSQSTGGVLARRWRSGWAGVVD